jgi:hypothetical protein
MLLDELFCNLSTIILLVLKSLNIAIGLVLSLLSKYFRISSISACLTGLTILSFVELMLE